MNSLFECCVCRDEFEVPNDHLTSCGHFVCENCVSQLRQLKCPYCRTPLVCRYLTEELINEIPERENADRIERLLQFGIIPSRVSPRVRVIRLPIRQSPPDEFDQHIDSVKMRLEQERQRLGINEPVTDFNLVSMAVRIEQLSRS